MMMNASWNPTIVRFEANQELKDTITFMSNNSDYHYREFLESDALLKSCNYELEFEKSKLCNGEKEISNMRAAMGEGYLSGCINGCDYYTIFNLYKIHEDNFNGCRSFCKSLADSYG
jgi:hypothetical protein